MYHKNESKVVDNVITYYIIHFMHTHIGHRSQRPPGAAAHVYRYSGVTLHLFGRAVPPPPNDGNKRWQFEVKSDSIRILKEPWALLLAAPSPPIDLKLHICTPNRHAHSRTFSTIDSAVICVLVSGECCHLQTKNGTMTTIAVALQQQC